MTLDVTVDLYYSSTEVCTDTCSGVTFTFDGENYCEATCDIIQEELGVMLYTTSESVCDYYTCGTDLIITSCAVGCPGFEINDPETGTCVDSCAEGVLFADSIYTCDPCTDAAYVNTTVNDDRLECAASCDAFVSDEVFGVQELYLDATTQTCVQFTCGTTAVPSCFESSACTGYIADETTGTCVNTCKYMAFSAGSKVPNVCA